MPFDDTVRHLDWPLREEQLAPLAPAETLVQLQYPSFPERDGLPSDNDFRRIARLVAGRPATTLRVYNGMSAVPDLNFLRFFPGLQGFSCELFELQSLDGIEEVAGSLRSFRFTRTRKAFAADFLSSMPRLERLVVEAHANGLDVLAGLHGLREVGLASVKLEGLDMLASLPDLWSLRLDLGATKNLNALRGKKGLKHLRIFRVTGLDDLGAIADMTGLQYLFLQDLTRVAELPAMDRLVALRRLQVDGLKDLRDFTPLLNARALEDLAVTNAPHVRLDDLLPLRSHPTLRRLLVGTGSLRRNEEITAALGLPSYRGQLDDDAFVYA